MRFFGQTSVDIRVNGELKTVVNGITILNLLAELGLAGKRVAVERNADIIPRSQHASTTLNDGDSLEIVQAIGGG